MKLSFIYLLLVTMFINRAFAQQIQKKVYGNFIVNKTVLQYTFSKMDNLYYFEINKTAHIKGGMQIAKNIKTSLSELNRINDSLRSKFSGDTAGLENLINVQTNLLSICNGLCYLDSFNVQELDTSTGFRDKLNLYGGKNIIKSNETNNLIIKLKSEFSSYTGQINFMDFNHEDFIKDAEQLLIAEDSTFFNAKDLNKSLNNLFIEIYTKLEFLDDAPITAVVQKNLNRTLVTYEKMYRSEASKKYMKARWRERRAIRREYRRKLKIERRVCGFGVDSISRRGSIKQSIRFTRTRRNIINRNFYNHVLASERETDTLELNLKQVHLEFEDGTIKNVFADYEVGLPLFDVEKSKLQVRFRNSIPISVSGKFDPDKFHNHSLRLSDFYFRNDTIIKDFKNLTRNREFEINRFSFDVKLSDIINYKIILANNNEDYSPENSICELNDVKTVVELKKEKRSKILNARMYTDFLGFNTDMPNGLVQLEVSKKVNISTIKNQGRDNNVTGINYWGLCTSIEPKIVISKLEDNNKYFPVSTVNRPDSLKNETYIYKIDILRYQLWSFGATINILKWNLPDLKSSFQLNGIYTYGRTILSDSMQFDKNIKMWTKTSAPQLITANNTDIGLGLGYEMKPDSRFGFACGYDYKWLLYRTKNINYLENNNSRYQITWFTAFLKTNETTKIFFRFRKYWEWDSPTVTFYQLQFGAEIDILGNKK